jgi:16S rRNA (cytidine1402-2'-O)-methyltransferase
MNRQKSFETKQPSVYLVPTPIGNLSEISERIRQVLEEADVIACEDTRNTGKLLNLMGMHKPLISHHEHNQSQSIPKIMELLQEGKSVAVCSDAGYPLLSDPGAGLVYECIQKEIPVISMSGPNAALNALVASGLDCRHYLFYGFLDAKSSARKKQLSTLKNLEFTLIFYEAPHRIEAMLKDGLEVLGDRNMCLARELTKVHEEYLRGSVSEILQVCSSLKGEMVVVIEGASKQVQSMSLSEAYSLVQEKIQAGEKMKSACKAVAAQYDLSKNELYAYCIEQKEKESDE